MLLYRFVSLILICITLAACGFQPLYYRDGERSSIRADLQSIYVRPIADRVGQELRIHLQDTLSPTSEQVPKEWELDVELTESIQKISVESTNFSTRANLVLAGKINLIPAAATEAARYSASFRTISSYNLVDSEYANLIAERNARSQAAVSLGNDIRRQLALWLRNEGG